MLVRVRAHQIPFNPRPVLVRIRAKGIRAAVKAMVMTEEGRVFPNPCRAPTVKSSRHIGICPMPKITR